MRSIYQRGFQRISRPFRVERGGQLRSFSKYLPHILGKSGLEIGGPSDAFRKGNYLPIYEAAGTLDNCDFSYSNEWARHKETFVFSSEKAPGRTFICDGSALVDIADSSYDFLLSSHNLEHFANPVRALKEWQRVLKPAGSLVLLLPYYRETFDHLRKPTTVEHMLADFDRNMAEDDLTHLPEILEKHDLALDIGISSKQEFHKRSLNNFLNRCLHHHVFDKRNSRDLLSSVGFDVLSVELARPHICILARLS
jgi:SAM-dependent methyltransferase